MIQANGLRIGNWVTTILSDNPVQIERISSQKVIDGVYESCRLTDNDTALIMAHIHPIPLTHEILEKAGFRTDCNGLMWLDCTRWSYIALLDGKISICIHNRDATIPETLPHIQYLHQLQNLYYVLTGEELNINI